MKRAPIRQFIGVAVASLAFVMFLPAGCRSVDWTDCIPRDKMPYALNDNGVKYYLVDHASIKDMIAGDWLKENMRAQLSETLKRKFQSDHDLTAYLEKTQERADKSGKNDSRFLRGIEEDQKRNGGELYRYKKLGKKRDIGSGQAGVEVENGLLILSRGRVFKKYVVGSGLEDEGLLKQNGIGVP
jgi:hypothetical protein